MNSDKKLKISLRRKILLSYVFALLLLSLILGMISVYMVDKLADTDSRQIMTQLCEKEALLFDHKLDNVSNSVDMIYEYVKELQSQYSPEDVYSKEFEKQVKSFALTIANQTEGAMAVYFRYNPEINGSGKDGFFWTKPIGSDVFEEEETTDILAFNSTDVEHVGWFYSPKEAKRSLWMSPYYNKNLGVFMISYVIPFYQYSGEFIGVIGMDINFKTIASETQGVQIYESGKVALADLNQRLIYFADDKRNVKSEKLSNTLYNHITTINKRNNLLEILDKDAGRLVICCKKISNGMVIYVTVPKREIDSNRNSLMMLCIAITILIFSISILYELNRTKKIVYPLERLTQTTQKYARGDWSSQYISETGDEIQLLSESISQMAKNTQEYIEKINNLARTDAITGIGNKTSYLELVTEIKKNRHHKYEEYAVAAFDLNLLKKANDTYGHETGDSLIKEASAYISRIFRNSAVFRTGGDEFIAILQAEDYQNRGELLEQFEKNMNYTLEGYPEIVLSISYGMAERSKEVSDYDSVFELADERMYQKKKEMKMERTD